MPDHLSDVTFRQLELDDVLLKALDDLGFDRCTPIQAKSLPHALMGRDVAGQAQTGTGKSAAFLLSTMQTLLDFGDIEGRHPSQPRAVILAPTRELAIQIHKDAVGLNKYANFRLGLVYGGTGYESQRQSIEEGVDILVGTPGRLIDYFKQGVFDFRCVDVFVLDEADRMFDMGFIKDLRFVMRKLPSYDQRQTFLFSATLSHRVMELAYEHMNDPIEVKVEADTITADRVRQSVYYLANDQKTTALIYLLKHIETDRTIVFVNMKWAAEMVCEFLEGNDIHAEVLSGDVPQNKRTRFLREFSEGQLPVLVCTDVAARGLHIPGVSHVINYDLPDDVEDYVHRIGRTARAGAEGDAISFACETYAMNLPEIEQYIERPIPVAETTEDMINFEIQPKKRRPRPQGQNRQGGGGRSQGNRSQGNRSQGNRGRR